MTLGTLHPETEPAGGTRRGGREVRSVCPWDLTRVTAAPASGLLMFWGLRILPSLLSLSSISGCKVPSVIYGRPFILIHAPPSQVPRSVLMASSIAGHSCFDFV